MSKVMIVIIVLVLLVLGLFLFTDSEKISYHGNRGQDIPIHTAYQMG